MITTYTLTPWHFPVSSYNLQERKCREGWPERTDRVSASNRHLLKKVHRSIHRLGHTIELITRISYQRINRYFKTIYFLNFCKIFTIFKISSQLYILIVFVYNNINIDINDVTMTVKYYQSYQ